MDFEDVSRRLIAVASGATLSTVQNPWRETWNRLRPRQTSFPSMAGKFEGCFEDSRIGTIMSLHNVKRANDRRYRGEGLTWCSTPINMGHFRGGWYHTCYRMNESDTGKIHFSNVLKKKKKKKRKKEKKNDPFLQMESFRNWWKSIDTKFNQWLTRVCARFVSFWKIDAVIYRLKCQLI